MLKTPREEKIKVMTNPASFKTRDKKTALEFRGKGLEFLGNFFKNRYSFFDKKL